MTCTSVPAGIGIAVTFLLGTASHSTIVPDMIVKIQEHIIYVDIPDASHKTSVVYLELCWEWWKSSNLLIYI